jgi:lysophospholipase L1-like esterase
MSSRRRIPVPVVLYTLAYGALYSGWLLHHSQHPVVLGRYSWGYLGFLAVMALPFFLPMALGKARRKLGTRRLIFALAPVTVLLLAAYLAAACIYYATQEHRFDPFLQMPPRTPAEADPPFDPVKKPGVIRVLALGGSTTELGYPPQLQTMLAAQYPGRSFEVLNAGRQWYTTRHSLINYTTICHAWKPDVVVIMHAINDLTRSFSPSRFALGEYNDQWSHYYGPALHGARPPTFEQHLAATALRRWVDPWCSDLLAPREVDWPLDAYRSIGPFEANLRSLIRYIRADGARVVLVTQPSLYKPQMSDEERAALIMQRFCVEDRDRWNKTMPSPASLAAAMHAFNEVTRRVAAELNVPLADAEARVPKDLVHLWDDVHQNGPGREKVAAEILQTLREHGLMEMAGSDKHSH